MNQGGAQLGEMVMVSVECSLAVRQVEVVEPAGGGGAGLGSGDILSDVEMELEDPALD